tara:strand:+ start:64 stop:510 length:447 start_codon:yes stop_codon:yes gene_type:complete
MTQNVLGWLDEIKTKIISLESDLNNKNSEVENLTKLNSELQEEIDNLSKVSLVAGLTRQVDEKNQKILILEKQLESYKNLSKNNSKLINDTESENDLEGFEIISHNDIKLLKDLETNKLYFLSKEGKKGKYAGKESKKGKIKLKTESN